MTSGSRINIYISSNKVGKLYVKDVQTHQTTRTGNIYLTGNRASLEITISCENGRATLVVIVATRCVARVKWFWLSVPPARPGADWQLIQQVIRSPQSTAEPVWLSIHHTDAPCLPSLQTCAPGSSEASVQPFDGSAEAAAERCGNSRTRLVRFVFLSLSFVFTLNTMEFM